MPKKEKPPIVRASDFLPEPCFRPCDSCGEIVLARIWDGGKNQWRDLPTPVSPAFGHEHRCVLSVHK